ncbi:hypothetical protein OB2597_02712 [Pseudooceanicola batsensis HTCC2597]|uniref:Uncharacterized protein n=1 Tax=Pseudooceanicola batsensis (strain ATCC BAA-863 / DSM 15984 / KCTC 12145 / HTCC2597) TaxID=252305 RepID=A3TXD6_PSEBH|nr:hypothetical protein OB2597_02712 [Pseudooceanicola batsensis HTCC2597]
MLGFRVSAPYTHTAARAAQDAPAR